MGLRLTERIRSFTGGSTPPPERSDDLFKTMSSLVAAGAETCSDDQLEVYDHALLELVELVKTETRRVAAQRLAALKRAPGGIIRRLANDSDIEVAAPLLSGSVVLTDDDLIDICRSQGDLHRVAIAERKVLSIVLCDVLVDEGSIPVKMTVTRNNGACLSERALVRLADSSAANYKLWKALNERKDIPKVISQRLVEIAKRQVRKRLEQEGRFDLLRKLDEAASVASNQIGREVSQIDTDYSKAAFRVQRLVESGRLTEVAIRRFAQEDRFADLVCSIAQFAKLPQACTIEWLSGHDVEPMLTLAAAHKFEITTVRAMLRCGVRRQRMNAEAREAALDRFEEINVGQARELLATWQKSFATVH